MKKSIIVIITFLLFNINLKLRSATPISPQRFLIVGGIIGGIELIHLGINIFKSKKENMKIQYDNNKTNISITKKIDKEKELKKLLAPSKLLSLVGEIQSTNSLNIISEKSNITNFNLTNKVKITTDTNKNNEREITNITYKTEKYNIKPINKKRYFTYTITNRLTKESYEYKAGAIDYYEVGIAYFSVGKKKKAKEYLLHTIAINERKEEAIKFLLQHYKITLQEIRNQARKYKVLKKEK